MGRRINLIPKRLVERRRRGRAVRAWVVFNTGLAVVLGVSIGSVQLAGRSLIAGLVEARDGVVTELAVMDEVLPPLREKVLNARRRLSVVERLRARPDWSVVLRLLEELREGQVVLDHVSIRPESDAAAPDKPVPVLVSIGGFARDSAGMLGYASRMQRTGLFDELPAPRGQQRGSDENTISFELEGRIAPVGDAVAEVKP